MKSSALIALCLVASAVANPFLKYKRDMEARAHFVANSNPNSGGASFASAATASLASSVYSFTQIVDHFGKQIGANGASTFVQKYFVSATYYKQGGPVLYFVQGESPADDPTLFGLVGQLAQRESALIVSLEHRFYGPQSVPTSDFSKSSLQLLTSEQNIEDIVNFKTQFPSLFPQYKLTTNTKWIAVGGSYPGFLAAVLREKHSDHFFAAHASSAPVLAKIDFWEYAYAVDQGVPNLGDGGSKQCMFGWTNAVKQFDAIVDQYLANNDYAGLQAFKRKFWLGTVTNVGDFGAAVTGVLASSVQYGPASSQWTSDGTWIEAVCGPNYYTSFTNPNATPSQLIADLQDLFVKNMQYQKFSSNDDPKIANIFDSAKTGLDISTSNTGVLWVNQFCREFGYFQNTVPKANWTESYSPYSKFVTTDYYLWACRAILQDQTVSPQVDQTNAYYGGLGMTQSNILWVNGQYDPWHWLSPWNGAPNPAQQTSVVIPAGTHCSDFSGGSGSAWINTIVSTWDKWVKAPITTSDASTTYKQSFTTTTLSKTKTTSIMNSSITSARASTTFAPKCNHNECSAGPLLNKGCSACAIAVCIQDPYCCQNQWDSTCVSEVKQYCTTVKC
ncbi:serine carboxypeptidase S28-domain-containing protein [Chytriomyces sp. MP71]|nr:serine carboxypeptidase S28-domain-containing protein [Chytriomyces sp. MP71]